MGKCFFPSKQLISIPTSAIFFVWVLKLADAEVCIHWPFASIPHKCETTFQQAWQGPLSKTQCDFTHSSSESVDRWCFAGTGFLSLSMLFSTEINILETRQMEAPTLLVQLEKNTPWFGSIWLCSTLPQTDILVTSSSLLCCCALLIWLRSHQTLHLRASTAMRWQPSWPPTSSMRRCTWPRRWLPSMSYCSQEDISFSTRCKILVHYQRTGTTHYQAAGSWRSLREWVWEKVLVLGMRCDMIDMIHLHVWCMWIYYILYVIICETNIFELQGGIEINLLWGL